MVNVQGADPFLDDGLEQNPYNRPFVPGPSRDVVTPSTQSLQGEVRRLVGPAIEQIHPFGSEVPSTSDHALSRAPSVEVTVPSTPFIVPSYAVSPANNLDQQHEHQKTEKAAWIGAAVGTAAPAAAISAVGGGVLGGIAGGIFGGAVTESAVVAGLGASMGAAGGAALATGISLAPLGVGAGVGALIDRNNRARGAAIGTVGASVATSLAFGGSLASLGIGVLIAGGSALAGVGFKKAGDWASDVRSVPRAGALRQMFRGIAAPVTIPAHFAGRVVKNMARK